MYILKIYMLYLGCVSIIKLIIRKHLNQYIVYILFEQPLYIVFISFKTILSNSKSNKNERKTELLLALFMFYS